LKDLKQRFPTGKKKTRKFGGKKWACLFLAGGRDRGMSQGGGLKYFQKKSGVNEEGGAEKKKRSVSVLSIEKKT